MASTQRTPSSSESAQAPPRQDAPPSGSGAARRDQLRGLPYDAQVQALTPPGASSPGAQSAPDRDRSAARAGGYDISHVQAAMQPHAAGGGGRGAAESSPMASPAPEGSASVRGTVQLSERHGGGTTALHAVQMFLGLGGGPSNEEVVGQLEGLAFGAMVRYRDSLAGFSERLRAWDPATFSNLRGSGAAANRHLVREQYATIAREANRIQGVVRTLDAVAGFNNVRQILSGIRDLERAMQRASRGLDRDFEADPRRRLAAIEADLEVVSLACSLLSDVLGATGVLRPVASALRICAGALNGVTFVVRGILPIFEGRHGIAEDVNGTIDRVGPGGRPITQ